MGISVTVITKEELTKTDRSLNNSRDDWFKRGRVISHAFKRHGMGRGDANLVLKRPGYVIKYAWLKEREKENFVTL